MSDDIWEGVQTCPMHPVADVAGAEDCRMDLDNCPGCQSEVTARTAVIDQMQAEANQRAKGLAQFGVSMPMEVMNGMKLDILIEAIINDPRTRLRFEGEFGRRVLAELKAAQERATRETIAPKQNLTVVRNNGGRGKR